MNILVVDDNVTSISILRVTLSKIGHRVFTARDGVEATAILKNESIDAVLTDWMMPNLDGIGLMRWIHETLRPVPIVIVTTALGSSEAQSQALEAGADACIAKPISPKRIDEALMKIHQNRNLQREQKPIHAISPVAHSGPEFFGIGLVAGTGGAASVRTILTNFESLSNAAWFIVLHGPGWAAEALAEQMRSYTTSNVVIPKDGINVEPNTMYIAPGDRHMQVASKVPVIQLTSAPAENFLRPSADPLFKSIARVFGSRALGVVLGGTGSDGSVGCGHIKVARGTVIVEERTNPVSSQMPQHIISLGLASQVLPLEKIAAGIVGHVRKIRVAIGEHSLSDTSGNDR